MVDLGYVKGHLNARDFTCELEFTISICSAHVTGCETVLLYGRSTVT